MELRRTRRSPRRFRAPGGTGHRLLWPVMPRQSGAADRRQKPIVCPTLTTQLGCSSAALYYTPLNSSQAATTLPWPKSEGRKSIAQCASTGNHAQDALAPERGVRIRTRGHLSPRSGAGSLANWTQGCAPWASIFRPPGSVRSMLFAACRFAGRPILPAAGGRSFHYFVPAASSFTLEKTAVSTVVATCEQTPKPTYTGSFSPTYSTGPTDRTSTR